MTVRSRRKGALLFLLSAFIPAVYADQGSLSNSGGSGSAGSGASVSSPVASPAGTVTVVCPGTGTTGCTGGTYSFQSNDGSMSIAATLTSGSAIEGCSGGGRGGHITCSWTISANFSGTLTINGAPQAIVGSTSQAWVVGYSPSGVSSYNSAYSPFYYSDSEQILRSDDLLGTNQITYGMQGGGTGQFYGAYGIALDSSGRIYVADTYNGRVVRIDNMSGANWTTYGSYGSGHGQFNDPQGIAVDSSGRIYVMDTNNSRLVRIDDMNGTNWTVFSNVGSGTGQVSTYLSVAVDSSGRIYIADTANLRIVRMDDMNGTNWTALSQSQPVNGVSYTFGSPAAVAVDSAGKIYVADNEYYAPAVVRVDDMTGANWTSLYVSPTGSGGLNSISVDASQAAFTGGGGAKIINEMAGVLTSSGAVAPYGTYYVFGVTPVPLPSPVPSAISLTPAALAFSQNVGTTSPAQTITVANFGGSPLNFSGITAAGAFAQTNNCPAQLQAGSNCTVSVTFTPSATGGTTGTLTVNDDSYNVGTVQSVVLNGTGTAPAATITPSSLSFGSVVEGGTSLAQNITLKNSGTGPMQVTSITAPTPFAETDTCTGSITIAAGASCSISVKFAPTSVGTFTAALTISDNAGTQTVNLSGSGTAQVTLSSATVSFGSVVAGNTSTAKSVTLTNHTTSTLTFTGIATASPFAISSNTCGSSIAGLANCKVSITFAPAAVASFTGTLTFTDAALNSPQTVKLTGTGSAPVTFSVKSLNFGRVKAGTTSVPQNVTVTNRLGTAISIASLSTSANFNVSSTTCGASLGAGATCTVSVTFSPAASGTVNGTLTLTDSAVTSPQTLSLTGTGS